MAQQQRVNEQPPARSLAMRERIRALYQQGSHLAQQDDILGTAFEELTLALEQLQLAEEKLRQQHERWQDMRAELEMEAQRSRAGDRPADAAACWQGATVWPDRCGAGGGVGEPDRHRR